MSDGLEIAGTSVKDAVPTELHGFEIKCGLGPYPPDAGHTHRRAMYARLRPITPGTRRIMARMHRAEIVGIAPLSAQAALDVELHPGGPVAEHAALMAVREASRLAADVQRSA